MGGMTYRPTSKVAAPSRTYWSPPRIKTPWSAKVGPYIGSNVLTLPVMMNTEGKPPGPLEKDSRTPEGSLPIHHHSNNPSHPTSQNKSQIIGREGHGLARNIKESIFIRVNNPTLNKNIDKCNLHHIWDRVLLNTPGLTLKRHVQVVGHANSNTPHLTQPNLPTHLGQPNAPTQIFTGSEHADRTS